MPGEELIGTIISSLTSLFGGIINTASTNKTNRQLQEQANQTNIALSAQSNKAAKQEAELAYQRSLPTQQVRNMQMAGMSKAGAINALNGGGSYTPAPVNTAQVEAPQVAGLDASLFSNLASIMSAERMQSKELKAAAREASLQRENAKEIATIQADASKYSADSSSDTAADRLEFDKYVYKNAAPLRQKQLEELDARIDGLKATTTQTKLNNDILELQRDLQSESLDYEKLRIKAVSLTTAAAGELERLIIAQKRGALLEMDSEDLRSFMQYKMRLELASMIGDAIKDEQWNKGKLEGKLKILQFIEDFLVGVKK